MNQNWKIRVQSAGQPFAFKATFLVGRTGKDESALDSRYVYGDGDLAVLLEDLGARAPEIWSVLETLQMAADIDEDAGQLRTYGPQGASHPLLSGNHAVQHLDAGARRSAPPPRAGCGRVPTRGGPGCHLRKSEIGPEPLACVELRIRDQSFAVLVATAP